MVYETSLHQFKIGHIISETLQEPWAYANFITICVVQVCSTILRRNGSGRAKVIWAFVGSKQDGFSSQLSSICATPDTVNMLSSATFLFLCKVHQVSSIGWLARRSLDPVVTSLGRWWRQSAASVSPPSSPASNCELAYCITFDVELVLCARRHSFVSGWWRLYKVNLGRRDMPTDYTLKLCTVHSCHIFAE